MVDSDIGESPQKFIFTSGEPTFNSIGSFWFLVFSAILVVGIYVLSATSAASSLPQHTATFVILLFALSLLFNIATRQWIVEIDLATRRLKISRQSFGRWTKTLVDCPLAKCTAFGTIEYNTDGHISYGAYVQLENGRQHAIPIGSSTFKEAARVASQLSAATGIPRLDTRF